MKSGTIKLIIDSALEHIALVGMAVNTISGEAGFSQETADQMELAVVEAVNNAMKHAYGNRAGREIAVIIEIGPDGITFQVRETGKPMAALNVPELNFDPGDIANLPVSGMGLYLIHQIMDEVCYASSEGTNILTMIKKLAPTV